MIDLHSHVLFDIDDGAQTVEDSLRILKRAEKMGITKMVATPHFSIGEDVDYFLECRNIRMEKLKEACRKEQINTELYCGAEVYITDEIFNEDKLEKLTIGKSDVLLSEFKYHGVKGEDFLEYIDEILKKGLKVLLAHPERYSYLRENALLMEALLSRDVMLQVNAISLFEDSPEGEFARMLVKSGLVYAIGSDIHHASSKRLDAMGELGKSGKWDKYLVENPEEILKKD